MSDVPATTSRFTDIDGYWESFDFAARQGVQGDENAGRMGMVHDGRYLYFVPGAADGHMVRYDTNLELTDATAWESFDIESLFATITSGNTKGYANGVFDGRHVYYTPYFDGENYHGRAVRYDTQGIFTDGSSWEAVDIQNFFPGVADARGYNGAVFDGKHVYFVPYHQKPMYCLGYHGKAVRYDTGAPFDAASSWQAIDLENLFAPEVEFTTGFATGLFDGRHVYYVPYFNSSGYHGKAVRYDSQEDFESPSAWQSIDISAIFPEVAGTKGYCGATFDGRYVYYSPYNDGAIPVDVYHGKMVRYDTRGDFEADASWEAVDLSQAFKDSGVPNTKGYQGAAFDGRYVYYAPWYDGAEFHGRVLRYDTQAGFADPSSWSVVDITDGVSASPFHGCDGALFDGKKYVYFNARSWGPNPGKIGKVARYDAVDG
jgi:hypothetical protein